MRNAGNIKPRNRKCKVQTCLKCENIHGNGNGNGSGVGVLIEKIKLNSNTGLSRKANLKWKPPKTTICDRQNHRTTMLGGLLNFSFCAWVAENATHRIRDAERRFNASTDKYTHFLIRIGQYGTKVGWNNLIWSRLSDRFVNCQLIFWAIDPLSFSLREDFPFLFNCFLILGVRAIGYGRPFISNAFSIKILHNYSCRLASKCDFNCWH